VLCEVELGQCVYSADNKGLTWTTAKKVLSLMLSELRLYWWPKRLYDQ